MRRREFRYSYSFDDELQQQWQWSERYASQPEILRYLEHVCDRYSLWPDIRLDTRVDRAHWDSARSRWRIGTSEGELEGRFVLMATGCLSKPNLPAIEGLDSFEGTVFHSGRWPREGIDVGGLRVGVVGTGSSGVQLISNLAPRVQSLHVFQRTPHWVVPAGNRPIGGTEERAVKGRYKELREELAASLLGMGVKPEGGRATEATERERLTRYERAWRKGGPCFLMCFDDLLVDADSNATACDYLAGKIREAVEDPDTAEALIPDARRFPVGARRLVMDDDYYARFNEPHVHLVDTRKDAIAEITATGIAQESGRHTDLDVIVLATGFDALTGALLDVDIRGEGGVALSDEWSSGPRSFLGLTVSGFPNLFTITGPGSPSVFSNVVLSIEQHIDFCAGIIEWMLAHRFACTQPLRDAEADWGQHVIDVARPTVLANADSWYWGANVEGKPRAFLPYLGGVGAYRDKCAAVVANGFEGFVFSRA